MSELYTNSLYNDARLIAYWRFEGNSNDSKGSRNGTDTSVSYGTNYGKYNQGVSLNSNSLITFTSYTPVSYTWWWYPTSSGGVFMRNSSSDKNFLEGNTIYDGTTHNLGATLRILNEWHHYAAVFSGGVYTFYRDGQSYTTCTSTQVPVDRFGRQDPANNTATGYVDDCAIWSNTLTQAEILSLYQEQASNSLFFSQL